MPVSCQNFKKNNNKKNDVLTKNFKNYFKVTLVFFRSYYQNVG